MAYDLVIRGGTVHRRLRCPSSAGRCRDLSGKVVAIGAIAEQGDEEIDAAGLFRRARIHRRARPLRRADLLGLAGELLIAARSDDDDHGELRLHHRPYPGVRKDLAIRSIERAEDIARDDMLVGVPWTWRTYADYLEAVDQLPKGINFAGYVGHSALRCFVMGERAYTDQATPEEIAAMRAEVEAALRAGAIGFSTSRISQHRTVDDGPVASYVASWEEVEALAGRAR